MPHLSPVIRYVLTKAGSCVSSVQDRTLWLEGSAPSLTSWGWLPVCWLCCWLRSRRLYSTWPGSIFRRDCILYCGSHCHHRRHCCWAVSASGCHATSVVRLLQRVLVCWAI